MNRKIDVEFTADDLKIDLQKFNDRVIVPAQEQLASMVAAEVVEQLKAEGHDPEAWVRGCRLWSEAFEKRKTA